MLYADDVILFFGLSEAETGVGSSKSTTLDLAQVGEYCRDPYRAELALPVFRRSLNVGGVDPARDWWRSRCGRS